jgi:hypothetical protein
MLPHASRTMGRAFVLLLFSYPQTGLAQQTKTALKTNGQLQRSSDTSVKSANTQFEFIKGVGSFGPPPNEKYWEEMLRMAGLTPWREKLWHLEAADGEMRAQAFFPQDETSLWLFFFPSGSAPLSDATLSWLYRTASSSSLEGGDQVDLQFPEESLKSGQGTRSQSFLLSLSSGRLERSVVRIVWKH